MLGFLGAGDHVEGEGGTFWGRKMCHFTLLASQTSQWHFFLATFGVRRFMCQKKAFVPSLFWKSQVIPLIVFDSERWFSWCLGGLGFDAWFVASSNPSY